MTQPSAPSGSAQAANPGLKRLVLRAGSWTMLGHLLSSVLRIASSLIMTRLLVPEMFGVMAVVTVVQVVVALLADVGIRQAVIQSARGDEPIVLDTAWVMQVMRGFIIWIVCALLALGLYVARLFDALPPASVYAAPELAPVLAVASLSAVLMGFQSTKAITCERHMDLRRVIQIDITAQFTGLAIMVLLGWWTRSIWSLVSAGIVSSLVTVALSHLVLPGTRNRLRWDSGVAIELFRFGRWVLLSSIFYVLAANGDRILLGAWVSAGLLGLYALALNLAALIEGAGSRLFATVATPALSKVVREQPERLAQVYYRMRLPFDVVFIGVAGGLYSAGQTLIDILYDPRYAEAGAILQVLSFGLLLARFGLTGSLYLAVGQPQNLSVVHLVKVISVFVLVPLAYVAFGFEGALWAIALHAVPTLPWILAYNRRLGVWDNRYEWGILLVWPLGYLAGLLGSGLVRTLLAWL